MVQDFVVAVRRRIHLYGRVRQRNGETGDQVFLDGVQSFQGVAIHKAAIFDGDVSRKCQLLGRNGRDVQVVDVQDMRQGYNLVPDFLQIEVLGSALQEYHR